MKICKKTLSLQPEISIIQCFMKKHYRIFEKLYNMLIFRHLELYIYLIFNVLRKACGFPMLHDEAARPGERLFAFGREKIELRMKKSKITSPRVGEFSFQRS